MVILLLFEMLMLPKSMIIVFPYPVLNTVKIISALSFVIAFTIALKLSTCFGFKVSMFFLNRELYYTNTDVHSNLHTFELVTNTWIF